MRRLALVVLLSLCVVTQASVAPVADVDATFQVALYYNFDTTRNVFSQRCTGVIISSNWVLTTASCLCSGDVSTCNIDIARWQIYFGAQFLSNAKILGVNLIQIHPFWAGDIHHGFDVALFRLNATVNSVRPDMSTVLLPESVEFECQDRQAVVYSWGTSSSGLLNQLVVTPAVIAADFVIAETFNLINNVREQFDVMATFAECAISPNCVPNGIAVQYSDARMGLCPTDIGSPLIWTTNNNQRVLLGLASYRFFGNGIFVNPNLPCVDLYVNNSGRVSVVFQQMDTVESWIRTTATNVGIYGSVCGDGLLGFNEECDDGNVVSGDGCSNLCRLESNFACLPARVQWIRANGHDDDDDDSRIPWIHDYISATKVNFCQASICHGMRHDSDDDGSSSCIIALVITLPVVFGVLLLCLIIICCIRRRKKNRAVAEPVAVVEPAPVAPMITTPASPIVEAPPTTPAMEVMSPVQMEIITPVYGMGLAEVMPPIIQREVYTRAPVVESTQEVAPTTWLKE